MVVLFNKKIKPEKNKKKLNIFLLFVLLYMKFLFFTFFRKNIFNA